MLLIPLTALAANQGISLVTPDLEQINVSEALLSIKGISEIIEQLNEKNNASIGILYGNSEMRNWADRVEQWLVSLGVERRRIRIQVGIVARDQLRLELQE